MSSVGGSSGSTKDTIEDLYDQYGEDSAEGRETPAEGSESPTSSASPVSPASDDASHVLAAQAGGSQIPQVLITSDDSGPDLHKRTDSDELRHQIESSVDPRSLTAGRALRPSRSATALLQNQSGTDTHQRSDSDELRHQIASNIDPLSLTAGRTLRPSRSATALLQSQRDSHQRSESEEFRHEIESNVDPRSLIAGRELRPSRSMTSLAGSVDLQALRAGEGLEDYRAMRQKAKAQLDREAEDRKAMGVIEKTPEQIVAEQQQNANLIAASSKLGPSGPLKGLRRAIQLREAFNKDSGKNLPGTSAVFEVTGKLTARGVKQGLEKTKEGLQDLGSATQKLAGKATRQVVKTLSKPRGGPPGPEDPKGSEGPDPEGPRDEDGYDADDPKGKRKAREEEE